LIRDSKAPEKLMVADNYLTIEAYALALQHGDDEFRLAVDRALSHIYRSGEIGPIFQQAFSGKAKPSQMLANAFRDLRVAGLGRGWRCGKIYAPCDGLVLVIVWPWSEAPGSGCPVEGAANQLVEFIGIFSVVSGPRNHFYRTTPTFIQQGPPRGGLAVAVALAGIRFRSQRHLDHRRNLALELDLEDLVSAVRDHYFDCPEVGQRYLLLCSRPAKAAPSRRRWKW
jgi:hypothetical protein